MSENPIEAAKSLFIRRWGEMGATWGISRTMAEIHALLYLATEPLCTDDVMEQLLISRGSASMNLRELGNWGLIRRVHRRGDRKEYFEAEKDVWQMFETIIRERRRREVLPIMETIERCLQMIGGPLAGGLPASDAARPGTRERIRNEPPPRSGPAEPGLTAGNAELHRKRYVEIREFCETMNSLFNVISKAGRGGLRPVAKTLGKLAG